MREILFRGKRQDNGIWIFGSFHKKIGDYYIIPLPIVTSQSKVIPETVGQFTGLLDKNGKKIFEGDIVLRSGLTWLIAFEKNAFVCKDSSMKTYFALWEQWEYNWKSAEDISPSDAFEVIGNIYDNPELLV